MRDFRQLTSWQRAHALSIVLYEVVRRFPREDRFAVGDQLRRSALSIGANIAEGAGRQSPADYARFLSMAVASANEVENHLLVANRVGLISNADHDRYRPS
jgi:four helix bundle protein